MDFKLILVVSLSLLVALTEAAPEVTTLTVVPASYDVGNGGDFVFTCKKSDGGDAPTSYSFKEGTTLITASSKYTIADGVLTLKGATAAMMAAKDYTCAGKTDADGPYSKPVTVEVKAIVAPKLTVLSNITDVAAGTEVTFTCEKNAANGEPKEYRFFKDTTDITGTSKTSKTLVYVMLTEDHDKQFHCQFWNTDTAKEDSNKLKATVKGGAAGGSGSGSGSDSGSEGIHMASLTTICLALVLSAIWKN